MKPLKIGTLASVQSCLQPRSSPRSSFARSRKEVRAALPLPAMEQAIPASAVTPSSSARLSPHSIPSSFSFFRTACRVSRK